MYFEALGLILLLLFPLILDLLLSTLSHAERALHAHLRLQSTSTSPPLDPTWTLVCLALITSDPPWTPVHHTLFPSDSSQTLSSLLSNLCQLLVWQTCGRQVVNLLARLDVLFTPLACLNSGQSMFVTMLYNPWPMGYPVVMSQGPCNVVQCCTAHGA